MSPEVLTPNIHSSINSQIKGGTNEQFNPEHIVNSKFTILENIAGKKQTSQNKETFIAEYKQKDKDLRLLAYQILVDKFNKKYKNLNESQRGLLKNYINNVLLHRDQQLPQ